MKVLWIVMLVCVSLGAVVLGGLRLGDPSKVALSEPAAALSAQLSDCASQRQNLQTQLAEATANSDARQQTRLNKSLERLQTRCADVSLIKQQEDKVLKAKREVGRRDALLRKAIGTGDAEKVDQRKDSLADSRKDLESAQTELERLSEAADDGTD